MPYHAGGPWGQLGLSATGTSGRLGGTVLASPTKRRGSQVCVLAPLPRHMPHATAGLSWGSCGGLQWPEKALRERPAATRSHGFLCVRLGGEGRWGTPTGSATNVKGLGLQTGLKVVLLCETGHTGGEASRTRPRELKGQLGS